MRKVNPGRLTRLVMEMRSKTTNCAMPPRPLLFSGRDTSALDSIKRSLNDLCRKSCNVWRSLLQPLPSFQCTLFPVEHEKMSKLHSMVRDQMNYLADINAIWECFMEIGGGACLPVCAL